MNELDFFEDSLFVLLHGFGNTPREMEQLERHFVALGAGTKSLTLPFHNSRSEFLEFDAGQLVERIELALREVARDTDKKLVLISTSLSSLAIELCEDLPKIDAHLALSPFLGLSTSRARLLAIWPKKLDEKQFRRRPDIGFSNLHDDVLLTDFFSFGSVRQLEELVKKAQDCPARERPKTIVIHSHDDAVASYDKSLKYYSQKQYCVEFVSLFDLPHIVAPSICPNAVSELLAHTFSTSTSKTDVPFVSEVYSEVSQENRAWADKVFHLVVGFLTVFGVLIFNSFSELSTASAYYAFVLQSYASVTFIYVLIASLYFYYLNRSQHYLQTVIEPLMGLPGYIGFRLNPHLSGTASSFMTKSASIPLIIVPMAIGAVSLVAGMLEVSLFPYQNDRLSMLLVIWVTINCLLLIAAIKNLRMLSSHTRCAVYSQRAPQARNLGASLAIARLARKQHRPQ